MMLAPGGAYGCPLCPLYMIDGSLYPAGALDSERWDGGGGGGGGPIPGTTVVGYRGTLPLPCTGEPAYFEGREWSGRELDCWAGGMYIGDGAPPSP